MTLGASLVRILIVEDEQVVAMDMEMQLTAFGYEVSDIAATGKEALHLVQTTCPDLILMDVQLHGSMDGFATAVEIQRTRPLPIVFVTAFGNQVSRDRAKTISPHDVLTKPFRPEALKAVVSAALEQHRTA